MNAYHTRMIDPAGSQQSCFKSSTLWNRLLPNILSKCKPEASGLIIPGSALNSDLSAPISFVKLKLKSALLASQRKGHLSQW